MKQTVLLGMSGGVDSTAAALILLGQGYDVTGVTLRLFVRDGVCGSPQDVADAQAAAARLGIPHRTLDLSATFRDTVQQNFIAEYQAGRTPNPCIVCNRNIKFGAMARLAAAEGFDFVATGHYARITAENGRYRLRRARDLNKDQSYVLYFLGQGELSRTLFPLGEYTKPEIRKMAAEAGMQNAAKAESQDICFIPDGDYAGFIQAQTGQTPRAGDFIAPDGTVLGRHRGLIHYTVGQRKGLGISFGAPMYVAAKNAADNTVTLAPDAGLYADTLRAIRYEGNLPAEMLREPLRVMAKIRYTQREPQAATAWIDGEALTLRFDAPQRAVTPGQTVVLYQDDAVIGGGIITDTDANLS